MSSTLLSNMHHYKAWGKSQLLQLVHKEVISRFFSYVILKSLSGI